MTIQVFHLHDFSVPTALRGRLYRQQILLSIQTGEPPQAAKGPEWLQVLFVYLARELLMEKVVIIGSSGAGKTTLAKNLGRRLGVKVFHMDRFFWQRDWKKKDDDTRIDILQKIVMEKRWIIEGSYLGTSEPRLNEADTIIFLDIHPFLCLQRVIKRHYEKRGLFRRDIPEGCTDRLTLLGLLEVLSFPWLKRRKLVQDLRRYNAENVIVLRSDKEVKEFLERLKQNADDKNQSSTNRIVAGCS